MDGLFLRGFDLKNQIKEIATDKEFEFWHSNCQRCL